MRSPLDAQARFWLTRLPTDRTTVQGESCLARTAPTGRTGTAKSGPAERDKLGLTSTRAHLVQQEQERCRLV